MAVEPGRNRACCSERGHKDKCVERDCAMTEDFCMQGPTGLRFTVRGVEFRHYRKGQTHMRGRWEASSRGRGTSGHRTPLGAYLHLRKWLREPARPV